MHVFFSRFDQAFVRHLSAKFYESFKVPENNVIPVEEVYERFSRELAFKLACNAGNQLCLNETYVQNHLFADNEGKIPKGMESVIFCSGFRGTNKQGKWTEMWKKMQSTSDATFKSQAISGLGCTDDKDLLKLYLESTIESEGINYTLDEYKEIVHSVLNSTAGLKAVINFFTDFELDVLRIYKYVTMEELVIVAATTVKNREQQALFMNFLVTCDRMSAAVFRNITVMVNSNFETQEAPTNANNLKIIEKIVKKLEEDVTTTKPPQTTTGSTVTTPFSTRTSVSTTQTNPTTESTTLGSSFVCVQAITILSCFFIAVVT